MSPDSATNSLPRLGIAIGDPNGIGPEISLKAALAIAARGEVRPVLIGDRQVLEASAALLGFGAREHACYDCVEVAALAPGAWAPGSIDARAGAATVEYVRAAIALWQRGELAAIAAAPHCETAVNAAGIPFSGYAGLVADLSGTPREQVCLLLEACGLRIVHVTLHESVASALGRMTAEMVTAAALAGVQAMRQLGVEQPSICLLGINPHAGEGGLFGDEDERITRPAVQRLRELGHKALGPVGADLALAERKHDLYVAPFHDQGHIAVKMLSPKGASALAAGAPVLFASVGHGAAFDIAGQGVADASALLSTLELLSEAIR